MNAYKENEVTASVNFEESYFCASCIHGIGSIQY